MVQPSGNSRLKFFSESDVSVYMKEVGRTRLLKPGEERALLIRAQQGDRKALNTLVEGNLRFVVSVCFNFQGRGMPLGDLINEGNLGLIKAVERFDLSKDYKFISYAVWWIRQSIFLALTRQTGFMSVPPNWAADRGKIHRADQKLFQKLGRSPMVEEIREETGLSERTIAAHINHLRNRAGLSMMDQDEGLDPLDKIAQTGMESNPEAETEASQFRKGLAEALGGLKERERYVIRHFFGLATGVPATLEEIGTVLGLSRERIRQIKDTTLSKLRRPGCQETLRDSFELVDAMAGMDSQERIF